MSYRLTAAIAMGLALVLAEKLFRAARQRSVALATAIWRNSDSSA
jgi:hypothetical protein